MKSPKPCKSPNCPKKRFKGRSLCYTHLLAKEREKRVLRANRALERKVKSKKYLKSEQKKWHRKTWKLMSLYIRKKGSDWRGYGNCYTCRMYLPISELSAGHWRHGVLDFDERNLKKQCSRCNLFFSGKLDVYTLRLIEDYGLEWVEKLRRDADRFVGYSLSDLKRIYEELKVKIAAL